MGDDEEATGDGGQGADTRLQWLQTRVENVMKAKPADLGKMVRACKTDGRRK
eukprot:COSAG02_NODE_63805_length_262_cov_0.638037_1_plen_51_part_10